MIGSTKFAPKEEWPKNFLEDPEEEGSGTYLYCPKCGDSDDPSTRRKI
jgi:hypothetical protein